MESELSNNKFALSRIGAEEGAELIKLIGMGLMKANPDGIPDSKHGAMIALSCLMEGKTPVQYLMEYDFIKAKPAKKAITIQGQFIQAGGHIKWHDWGKDGKKAEATFTYKGDTMRNVYTIEEAKKEIDSKTFKKADGNWQRRPGPMLCKRLLTQTLRLIAPELVIGVYTADELGDDRLDDDLEIQQDAVDAEFTTQPAKEETKSQPTEQEDSTDLEQLVEETVEQNRIDELEKRGKELLKDNPQNKMMNAADSTEGAPSSAATEQGSTTDSAADQQSGPAQTTAPATTDHGIDENGIPDADHIITPDQMKSLIDIAGRLKLQAWMRDTCLPSARAVDTKAKPLVPKYEGVPVGVPGAKNLTKEEATRIIAGLVKHEESQK